MPRAAGIPDRGSDLKECSGDRRRSQYLAGLREVVHPAGFATRVDIVGNPGRFREEGCGLVRMLSHEHGYHNFMRRVDQRPQSSCANRWLLSV